MITARETLLRMAGELPTEDGILSGRDRAMFIAQAATIIVALHPENRDMVDGVLKLAGLEPTVKPVEVVPVAVPKVDEEAQYPVGPSSDSESGTKRCRSLERA